MNTNNSSGNSAAFPNSPEPLVGFVEVARHLGVCKRTVQYHMKRGLPHYPMGRLIRFRLSEVDTWVAARLRIDTSLCKTEPGDSIDLSGPKPTIKIKRPAG